MLEVSDLLQLLQEACATKSAQDYQRAQTLIYHFRDALRETIQEDTAPMIALVIGKLEKREKLDATERGLVRLWVAGDAASYVRQEQNFEEWSGEFARLTDVVARYDNRDLSLDDLTSLQGVLEDAGRVAADLGNFMEQKDRLARFDQAMGALEDSGAEVLVRILKAKLDSPNS